MGRRRGRERGERMDGMEKERTGREREGRGGSARDGEVVFRAERREHVQS